MHTIGYVNANILPSVGDPVLPISLFADNGSNNIDIVVKCSEMSIFVEGEVVISGLHNSVDNIKNIGTIETNILTLKNNLTYVGKTNHHAIFPTFLSVASIDGKKPVAIKLIVNATLGGTPSFIDVDTNTSIASWDISGSTVTGGNVAMTTVLGKEDSVMFEIAKIIPFIEPGDTLTVSAVTSTSTVDILAAISWIDDI